MATKRALAQARREGWRIGSTRRRKAQLSAFDAAILDVAGWLLDRANSATDPGVKEVRKSYGAAEHDAVLDMMVAYRQLEEAVDLTENPLFQDDYKPVAAALTRMLLAESRRVSTGAREKSRPGKPRGRRQNSDRARLLACFDKAWDAERGRDNTIAEMFADRAFRKKFKIVDIRREKNLRHNLLAGLRERYRAAR